MKVAGYQLAKTLKAIVLKLGNVYTNGNEEELKDVLNMVIPMIIDDCIISTKMPIKYFGLDILQEIVKSSQN